MEKYYIAAICGAQQIGSARVQKLLKIFGNAKEIWTAERGELEKAGLPSKALESFIDFRSKNPKAPEKLIDYCIETGVKLCSFADDDYPPILKEIQLPPPVFYYYGQLQTFAERIAMVGTRSNTPYGQRIAMEIAEGLAAAGITIVSGAARGIDTYSHIGAMKYGRTVAVLGCGIAYAFIGTREKVIRQIAENGVVMTDFNPSQRAGAETFPARNRIIAGLSRGVIMVEAGKKSGANITCSYAGDYGRDVFAVPGNVDSPKSIGCNELIRDSGGGTLIRSANDILDFYNWSKNESVIKIKNESVDKNISEKKIDIESLKLEGVEKKVFDAIPSGDFIEDEKILLAVDAVIEPYELSSVLLQLELKNCIVEQDGRYTRKT